MSERRKLMKSVLKLRSEHLRIAEQFDATANDMIAAVRQQQVEGVVGKRKDVIRRTSICSANLQNPASLVDCTDVQLTSEKPSGIFSLALAAI